MLAFNIFSPQNLLPCGLGATAVTSAVLLNLSVRKLNSTSDQRWPERIRSGASSVNLTASNSLNKICIAWEVAIIFLVSLVCCLRSTFSLARKVCTASLSHGVSPSPPPSTPIAQRFLQASWRPTDFGVEALTALLRSEMTVLTRVLWSWRWDLPGLEQVCYDLCPFRRHVTAYRLLFIRDSPFSGH